MNIFTSFFSKPKVSKADQVRNDLLRREAIVGGTVFGPVPEGVTREFFCLEKNTWVWVENYTQDGKRMSRTTKYLIRPTALVKSVNGSEYKRTSLEEAENFVRAVEEYTKRVREDVYGLETPVI